MTIKAPPLRPIINVPYFLFGIISACACVGRRPDEKWDRRAAVERNIGEMTSRRARRKKSVVYILSAINVLRKHFVAIDVSIPEAVLWSV